jgi:dTDP-4-dehydrorhamnose reductase
MRVAVFGARGTLGSAMAHGFRGHDLVAFDRATVDITSHAEVERAVTRVGPDVLINCAAYNAVDAAEDHPLDALAGNAFAVRTLARVARAHGATLVHYSSDFVFDGAGEKPYTELDQPNPRSVYAASKMLGEWFAADAPEAYVLRVESLFGRFAGGPPEKGSVAGVVGGLLAGSNPKVFEDRTVSPTYVPDAVTATLALLERKVPPGVYHCVSTGHCTWLEFAREAARLLGVEPRVQPVRMADMSFRAPRPLYCALSNEKLTAAGIVMPTWQDALARHIRGLETGSH